MATDSSSGTLPSSSRLTIDSSSSIARSKLSFLTSAWVFSAISVPGCVPYDAHSKISMRRHCGGNSRAHQCGDMRGHRLFQSFQIIPALEHRDHPAASAGIGDVHQSVRDPAEIFRFQVERGQRIKVMRVEAGGDDDQFGIELL